MSAHIDLNPVRAGMVDDLADYRWSGYGESAGGGKKGNGKKAREGLLRAYFCDQRVGFEVDKSLEVSRLYRRQMGVVLVRQPGRAGSQRRPQPERSEDGQRQTAAIVTKNTAELLASEDETVLEDLGMAKLLRCRISYFAVGTVTGSRELVNEAFTITRERFGSKRKDCARKLKGGCEVAGGTLSSLRDLRKKSDSARQPAAHGALERVG